MQRSRKRLLIVLLLFAATPLAMGGCPEFQDSVVAAIETATRGVVDAAVTLFFDQYRSD
jgi:hypothetical protein